MCLHIRDNRRYLGVAVPPCALLRSAARQWRVASGLSAGLRSGVHSMLGRVIPNLDFRELGFVQVAASRDYDTAVE
jgi:hypothetical protein